MKKMFSVRRSSTIRHQYNTKQIKATKTYFILKKTEVPTVIVECGFLSNYKEAQKLVTEDYQKSVAEAVAEGILSYIKENE